MRRSATTPIWFYPKYMYQYVWIRDIDKYDIRFYSDEEELKMSDMLVALSPLDKEDIKDRALVLASYLDKGPGSRIVIAAIRPWIAGPLEIELKKRGCVPLYDNFGDLVEGVLDV